MISCVRIREKSFALKFMDLMETIIQRDKSISPILVAYRSEAVLLIITNLRTRWNSRRNPNSMLQW